jgi:hypothetical protein
MIRSDIEKLFSIFPKTIYTVRFFKFISKLKSELKPHHDLIVEFRELIKSSEFMKIEMERISIINGEDAESKLKELSEKYSSEWESYIVMISEVNKFFAEDIPTHNRISLEDVPDKFVETLDDDGIRIFSEFFN